MNLQSSLEQYLTDLASASPTPGGGNVSALCGVLSASLGQMVCSLTIGKKKYLDVEEELKKIKEKLKDLSGDFLSLAEKDNKAFDKVMQSFKLPKETDQQKSERAAAIDAATMEAAIVPAEVIIKCDQMLSLLQTVAEKGNKNSLSDAGVAISLVSAAAEGAFLNVAINCSGLSNRQSANEFMIKSELLYSRIKEKAATLNRNLIASLKA